MSGLVITNLTVTCPSCQMRHDRRLQTPGHGAIVITHTCQVGWSSHWERR